MAGNGTLAYSIDTRGALQSGFAYLTGIAVDSTGNLYLSEEANNKIKKVTPAGRHVLLCGTGAPVRHAWLQRRWPGGSRRHGLGYPGALAVDKAGNLYITDSMNARIRKVDPHQHHVTTIAGTGSCCYKGR